MEADSTTIENDCYDFTDNSETERESPVVEELLKCEGYFQDVLRPLLKKEERNALLSWMKENNLIPSSQACPKGLPGCNMVWTTSRVVDKFQWKCKNCKHTIAIRENSFFKLVFCSFSIIFKILLAWCQDMDIGTVATAFGIKRPIVNHLYDKIETIITTRLVVPLGGPGRVVLVEVYPDSIGEQFQPDSSKNDSSPVPKQQYKILCLADTTQVPTRYWLHLISGYITMRTENNNTKVEKAEMHQEVLTVLEQYVAPGSLCAIGGGKELILVQDRLKERVDLDGVACIDNLLSQSNIEMKAFLRHGLWRWPVKLCEAASELQRNKMQTYLSCSVWRRDVENKDTFLSLIRLIAEHDHSKKYTKKRSKS